MSRIYSALIIVLTGLSLFAFSVSSVAADEQVTTTVVERHVIVTPVPAAKEVIVTPEGYASCFTVAANWVNDIWVPEHQVCQYANSPQGVAWVDGYWACSKYKATDGTCTSWDWKAGHWVKSFEVY